jgi:hypothetical protein
MERLRRISLRCAAVALALRSAVLSLTGSSVRAACTEYSECFPEGSAGTTNQRRPTHRDGRIERALVFSLVPRSVAAQPMQNGPGAIGKYIGVSDRYKRVRNIHTK